MALQIQLRNDTAANWTSVDPILATAEIGVESDTLQFKVGDGTTAWSLLAYSGGGGGTWDGDITDIDLDGGTDIGADLVDADLILVDDGAAGTNRKSAISRLWTYIKGKASATFSAGDVIKWDSTAAATRSNLGTAAKREYKSSDFTAEAYGRYHTTNAGTLVVTNPSTGALGDIFDVVIATGSATINGVTYTASRFPIEVICTVAGTPGTWVTPAATVTGAFNATSIGATTPGTGAFTTLSASGVITATQSTDATTPVNALTAATSTAATNGAQKWSPVIKQSANGWGTTAGTSQDVTFSTVVKPTQGLVPTGTWALQSSIAGGALTDRLTVDSTGAMKSDTSISSPLYYGSGFTNGILRMDGNTSARGLGIGSLNIIAWASGAYSGGTVSGVTMLGSQGTANVRQGAADAATAVAQTFSVQSVVAGTTDTAGANRTITGSQGTGTGVGGSIIFQTAPAGSTGSTQNALVTQLTVSTTGVSVAGATTLTGSLTPNGRVILPMGEVSYFDTTGTGVTISGTSDGSTNMVVIAPATAVSGDEYLFDNGGSDIGRLRYTGTLSRMFHIAVTLSLTPATLNDIFVIGIAKSGTVVASSKVLGSSGGTQFSALHLYTTLTQNQYLEVYIGNTSGSRNATVKSLNIFAMGM